MTKQQTRSKLRLMLRSRPGSDGTTKVASSLRNFIEGDFDRYLRKEAPVTYRVHRNLLANHVLNTGLADSELVNITFQDCQDLIDVEIRKFENRNQSWDTVRNILKVLRSVLGYAVKMDILKINAAKCVTLPQKPVSHWNLVKPEKIDGLIQKAPTPARRDGKTSGFDRDAARRAAGLKGAVPGSREEDPRDLCELG